MTFSFLCERITQQRWRAIFNIEISIPITNLSIITTLVLCSRVGIRPAQADQRLVVAVPVILLRANVSEIAAAAAAAVASGKVAPLQ